ncbi:MAG TPA: ASKHA domain-containing protein [Candidatus Paceibacterota bacterium]|nr:ASKHA domain-containing protein [Verrucomicrobiota bacterium]HRZ45206.1 ASKHA domain-containing protein [Candidatus Paceibacterota bacterium]
MSEGTDGAGARPKTYRLALRPQGATLALAAGMPLQDVLFEHGVEFPCGGKGVCRGCRVRVIEGRLPESAEDQRLLTRADLDAGWRLACRARIESDLTLELAQWEAAILSDHGAIRFRPREGWGVAIDLGTTTMVAQLLDLQTAETLAVRAALNPQAQQGADVMSRVQHGLTREGRAQLTEMVRGRLGQMIAKMAKDSGGGHRLTEVVIVGNTVMHHLFGGLPVDALARYPFESDRLELLRFESRELGWDLASNAAVDFLPCLGGFVGSDILAGILATGLDEGDQARVLVDLGTNGEIVVGDGSGLLCASTAAGPAFEGARIAMGMRAATGAIAEVKADGGRLAARVLGGGAARGICGSGLVDAAAAGLELGWIQPSGRLAGGRTEMPILAPVKLTQGDLRELQLAKGAIAAGLRLLLAQRRISPARIRQVHLAGAFGNYISRRSARRIGLLDFPLEQMTPAGNTALHGAKIALFAAREDREFPALRRRIRHVRLSADPAFEEQYVECMAFP